MNPANNGSMSANGAANGINSASALLSATSVIGDDVCNLKQDKLDRIEDIMLDLESGKIRYAVVSSGGFLGMGDRLFAVPWQALKQDREHKRFTLNIETERLKKAPGFDKESWPDMADSAWNSSIESYYTSRSDSAKI
ncbi:MAG: PRC-barrel domain-containing protein [Xanthomonadaceae bacterium]|nr:PRC-barrel domain-containing protein [Xanthomonadaceae bacterium]